MIILFGHLWSFCANKIPLVQQEYINAITQADSMFHSSTNERHMARRLYDQVLADIESNPMLYDSVFNQQRVYERTLSPDSTL